MKKILETERLLLCEFALPDAGFILQLMNSPGWLQYIGDRNMHTLMDAELYLLNGPMKNYKESGAGLWKVRLKSTGAPIGMCGLVNRPFLPGTDIGYALLSAFEGRGYAYEAALATVNYARTALGLHQLFAITNPANVRSVKLLDKLGLKFEGMIPVPGSNEQVQLMGIDFDV